MVGAKLVLPGPALDGKSLHELIESENVTFSAGVPTVWQALLNYCEENKLRFSTMRRTHIVSPALARRRAVSDFGLRRRGRARLGSDPWAPGLCALLRRSTASFRARSATRSRPSKGARSTASI